MAIIGTLFVLIAGLPGPVAAALPLTEVAAAHDFSEPLYLTNAGDDRLFVIERGGTIKIIHPDQSVTTFLTIDVSTISNRGMLGLAFHPGYASNGLFYVDYVRDGGDIVIAEFRVSENPDVADENSERIVLTVDHADYAGHFGGWLGFNGGHLFISVGDGGEFPATAQDRSSMLGKILRIQPADPDGDGPQRYGVPSSNPFVNATGLDEIWAFGLRNPWRCSHDGATNKLWCGDVGQERFEEVDRKGDALGSNFGWPLLEGKHWYPEGKPCRTKCRTLPLIEYKHSAKGEQNCSVTGGYVARRPGAALFGRYIYGDLCSGRVWSVPANFQRGGAVGPVLANTSHTISSFGEDANGRLYLIAYGGGIYRLNGS
ncbi:MAG TPA: PQQ-dependent sugar dehydrogenase [Candidatus Limnocylindrales bacterium]|nr:PQQ-dependent sugar dehydrogenase [Candidatus Limnocylindrales bacterium]